MLREEPELPDEWWASLRTDVTQLATAHTDRVAVRQEDADRSVPRFTRPPTPQVTE